MTSNDPVEVSASSIDEAIRQALEQLGATEDDVVIEILTTPRSGVLGLGSRQARVRVKRRASSAAHSEVQSPPPAREARRESREASGRPPRQEQTAREAQPTRQERPAEDRDEQRGGPPLETLPLEVQARQGMALLSELLGMMKEPAAVIQGPIDAESIELEIKGDGSGLLIGRHGQTLDALEYIINRILARRIKDAAPVVIDTESYRARHRQQLERMALSVGERAKREHQPIVMQPMPPRDRRIIHLALKDDPLLTTRSSGSGYLRAVEVVPSETRRERTPREPKREEREREQPREPAIGEQGGFKHGQKRIV